MSKSGQLVKSEFTPPWWAKNRHVQTVWPRFFQKRKKYHYHWEQLTLPDGDFVELTWGKSHKQPKGLVVGFHGLEGSIRSHYANDMMAVLAEAGWQTVMMHFRGCGTKVNAKTRAYHSGETQDASFFLNWVTERFPGLPTVGIGFSLGANMLLKLMGEKPKQNWLSAVVAVSPPFSLARCSDSICRGLSQFYEKFLLSSMRSRLLEKMQRLDYSNVLTIKREQVPDLKGFRDYDQHVTAPLHGFNSADDYYQKSSCEDFLKNIETPTLILHAKDDPFMSEDIVPSQTKLSPAVRLELSDKGGHVGFMQGSPWSPVIWTHQRVLSYFQPFALRLFG